MLRMHGTSPESSEAEREKIERREKMDRSSGNGGGGYWFWALASAGQLAAGVLSYRRGYAGDSHIMPFKAFTVASLFVGAGATSVAGFLHFSGIHKVEDLKEVGANIRIGLGLPPRDTTR